MVKSRLSADLGAECAANIYKKVLEKVIQNICICIREFEVFLYCCPDINYSLFNYYKENYNLSLHNQIGNDLGTRMYNAMSYHLSITDAHVVLIGSDCLEINSDYINNTFGALESGNDLVLGPTLDGGYALIGANKIDVSIFSDISWGTSSVLRQTKRKINTLEWKFTCMPSIRDIDTLADYQYFSRHKKFKHLFLDINKKHTLSC